MYAAMGAPYAGFGTSQVIDDSIPTEGAPSGPSSAGPAPASPAPALMQTGNGMQSGTEREIPLHMQQAQQQQAQYAVQGGAPGVPWTWLAVGVGVTALGLWYFNRRRSHAG